MSKSLDNYGAADSDSFKNLRHRGEKGAWLPIYPEEIGRGLKHVEADYNYKLLTGSLANYRIYPNGQNPSNYLNVEDFSGQEGQLLKLAKDGDQYYWTLVWVTGADGTNQGQKGEIGFSGPKGEKGEPAPDNSANRPSASGPTGPKGDKGDDGNDSTVSGPKGDKGEIGATGPGSKIAGPSGPKGDAGNDSTVSGPSGPKGNEGADSTVSGPKGDKGTNGNDSTTSGPKGDKGEIGATGPGGGTGKQGNVGPVGPSGPKGQKGTNGNDSTTSGPKGQKGTDGNDSTTSGPKGDKGEIGVTGPGSSFSTDYYTQNNDGDTLSVDKLSLINNTDRSIVNFKLPDNGSNDGDIVHVKNLVEKITISSTLGIDGSSNITLFANHGYIFQRVNLTISGGNGDDDSTSTISSWYIIANYIPSSGER